MTPLERVAVSAAAESAATRQDSLAPLFANLGAVAASNGLPQKLQQAVMQVLAQRTSLDPALSGGDIKNAFQKSGILLEAALASGSVSQASGIPDLKAALIVLRQTLVTSLGPAGAAEGPAAPATVAAQPVSPGATNIAAADAAAPRPAAAPQPAAASPTLVSSLSPDIDPQEILPPQVRAPVVDDFSATRQHRPDRALGNTCQCGGARGGGRCAKSAAGNAAADAADHALVRVRGRARPVRWSTSRSR